VESLYPYDLDKAKQLLQGAGWVAGADGIRTKGGQKMTVLMNVTPSAASYDELFQSQMRAAGIDLQLTRGTAAAVTEAIVRGDINMALNGWVSSDPVVLTNMFHSKNNKSGYGWAKYADPKLDGLLEEGERTLDEAKRGQIYADVQKIIMQQALIIPLFASANTIGVHARYKDVKRDFRNYVWLYDAYIG
jgi:peptide/nickel transport system substrate-binding protein